MDGGGTNKFLEGWFCAEGELIVVEVGVIDLIQVCFDEDERTTDDVKRRMWLNLSSGFVNCVLLYTFPPRLDTSSYFGLCVDMYFLVSELSLHSNILAFEKHSRFHVSDLPLLVLLLSSFKSSSPRSVPLLQGILHNPSSRHTQSQPHIRPNFPILTLQCQYPTMPRLCLILH